MSTFLLYGFLFVVLLNVFMFYWAYRLQTDKLTDITYSASFAALSLYSIFMGDALASMGKLIMGALVLMWALRLGYYLFDRVSKIGKDERFDEIRVNKKRFFRFFLLQGVSSWVISLPFMIRLSADHGTFSFTRVEDLEWVGLVIALVGLIVEGVADAQKSAFKAKPGNSNEIYTEGLYSKIRYPNYLGEIVFWVGIFLAAIPFLSGWGWASVISPIAIILLLLFVSGIPFLERGRAKKYGDDPKYQAYHERTYKIIPGVY